MEGYCSKLGYARPLGWGSVSIEARELYFVDFGREKASLQREANIAQWFQDNWRRERSPVLEKWLDVHQRKHPEARDYPRHPKDNKIHTFHTRLRADHSRLRRQRKNGSL